MKKILLLLTTIILLTGCSYDPYEYPDELEINTVNNTINVFDEFNTTKYITTNGEILNNTTFEVNEIGNYTYTYEIKYKKKTYKYDLSYEVKDVTPPVFISATSKKTIELNQAYIPCNNIVYADDYDNSPSCEIIGEYDLTKLGTYNLQYRIFDHSNNEEFKDLVLNVVEQINTSSNTSTSSNKKYFSDIISTYKNEDNMIGIDVSKWQGEIDFNKVKEAGAEFVIIRIGVTSNPGDEISLDKYYEDNIKKASEAGLKVGVYFYSSATTPDEAENQAKWIIEKLNGQKLDLGVSFDWENWSKFMNYKLSLHDLDDTFNAFAKVIKDNNYDVYLYSSKFYLEHVWINKNNYPVWLAHYINQTTYKGNYKIWQMANTGRINGIYGDVDIDILYLNN